MTESILALPELKEIQDLLKMTKKDLLGDLSKDPEFAEETKVLNQLVTIIQDKISKTNNLNSLPVKDQIDIAAHLNFFHTLLEEIFAGEEDFDEEEFEDEEFEEEER